jgi:catechol 2,3-dioxygenase-like lactoylglutathione lyase family enzyme
MELRLVLTVEDFDAAVAVYRDALGMPELDVYESKGARIALLDAGRATLEVIEAAAIDQIEVGRRVAGPVRIALEVEDSAAMAGRLGLPTIAGPAETPWHHLNVRLDGPAGVQLTLFQRLDGAVS